MTCPLRFLFLPVVLALATSSAVIGQDSRPAPPPGAGESRVGGFSPLGEGWLLVMDPLVVPS